MMYGLVNNSTCQCTCQKPYLGDPGNNSSDIVQKSLKYLIETKYIVVSFFLNLWIYVGFTSCLNRWCHQSGTNNQYTKCKRVSEDGRTCYNPEIRYGTYTYTYGIGGYVYSPYLNSNNNIHLQWCRQLFPKSNIISSRITSSYTKPYNYRGGLNWCMGYDENRYHWCAMSGGYWLNRQLSWNQPYPIVDSLTCLPKKF